jgi:hypothetical protein
MEMYYFVTDWFFQAPIERVWEALIDIRAWPTWWQGWKKATIRGPEPVLQSDSAMDGNVRAGLPYTLSFSFEVINFQPPNLMRLRSSGDLVGDWRWVLESKAGGTAVTAYWDCGTAKPIFNLLVKLPFVKAMLERNHDDLMSIDYRALKSKLEE